MNYFDAILVFCCGALCGCLVGNSWGQMRADMRRDQSAVCAVRYRTARTASDTLAIALKYDTCLGLLSASKDSIK